MIEMSNEKYRNRYYYKESYETAIGTFATAIVFLFVAILSLFFRTFKFDFIGLDGHTFHICNLFTSPAFCSGSVGIKQLLTSDHLFRSRCPVRWWI